MIETQFSPYNSPLLSRHNRRATVRSTSSTSLGRSLYQNHDQQGVSSSNYTSAAPKDQTTQQSVTITHSTSPKPAYQPPKVSPSSGSPVVDEFVEQKIFHSNTQDAPCSVSEEKQSHRHGQAKDVDLRSAVEAELLKGFHHQEKQDDTLEKRNWLFQEAQSVHQKSAHFRVSQELASLGGESPYSPTSSPATLAKNENRSPKTREDDKGKTTISQKDIQSNKEETQQQQSEVEQKSQKQEEAQLQEATAPVLQQVQNIAWSALEWLKSGFWKVESWLESGAVKTIQLYRGQTTTTDQQ